MVPSAEAIQARLTIEGFPFPPSTWARNRSESPTWEANSLRLQPFSARRARTMAPSEASSEDPWACMDDLFMVT